MAEQEFCSTHRMLDNNIIITSLTEDVVAEVFAFLGPVDTAKCAMTCRLWRNVSTNSRSLWRNFTYRTFGLAGGSDATEWYYVYKYLTRKSREIPQLLPARVVFSDDGSPIPGYRPENAVRNDGGSWCTNVCVNRDVDLVLDLHFPALVCGFVVENGGLFFERGVGVLLPQAH